MSKSQSPYDRRQRPALETELFQRAWAIVSKNPQISRQELADEMEVDSLHTAQYWVERLAAAGVIEIPETGAAHACRALRVVIPLALVTKNPVKKRRKK